MHVKSCFDGIRTHASQLLVGHYYQLGYVATYLERGKFKSVVHSIKESNRVRSHSRATRYKYGSQIYSSLLNRLNLMHFLRKIF